MNGAGLLHKKVEKWGKFQGYSQRPGVWGFGGLACPLQAWPGVGGERPLVGLLGGAGVSCSTPPN